MLKNSHSENGKLKTIETKSRSQKEMRVNKFLQTFCKMHNFYSECVYGHAEGLGKSQAIQEMYNFRGLLSVQGHYNARMS